MNSRHFTPTLVEVEVEVEVVAAKVLVDQQTKIFAEATKHRWKRTL